MSNRSKISGSIMARLNNLGARKRRDLFSKKGHNLFAASYEPNICLVMKKSIIFPMTPDKAYAKPSIISG